jgi:hypothetical protein
MNAIVVDGKGKWLTIKEIRMGFPLRMT